MDETRPLPPWADQIPEGSFISYTPTYRVGEYFNLFKSGNACGMKYYFYDPTENGYPAGKEYPLLTFLHGRSNALEGDICINYTGAEFYATEKYQSKLGGAYILIPVANEKRNKKGYIKGTWDKPYTKPLYTLINFFIKNYTLKRGGVNKKFIFGNSAGARMTYILGTKYPSFFDALIPIGGGEIPSDKTLDDFDRYNVHLFLANAKRDELNDYNKLIVPRLPRLNKMKHCFIFTPEWVYNGDKGIASIFVGIEMGQHCLVNPMHCNLTFDDGTPMEKSLPDGVLGWLKTVIDE